MKFTKDEFIEKARKVHGNKFDYSKVDYKNSNTKVCIICPIHGEFWQTPASHLSGRGCNLCSKPVHDTKSFITEARKVHGDKYDYSKVNYKSCTEKVCIICHEKDINGVEHGEFWQTPNNHLRNRNCPKCGRIGTTLNQSSNSEEFIKKAKKIHRNKYDYSNVNYVNNHTLIKIICPEHGEFWQTPHKHLAGHKCPKCRETNLEKTIREMLEDNNIEFIYQANKKNCSWLGRQTYDFYLPAEKIAIECQGHQHYFPVSFKGGENKAEDAKQNFILNLKRDFQKKVKSLENGITLIYFTLPELKKNEEFISEADILQFIINKGNFKKC